MSVLKSGYNPLDAEKNEEAVEALAQLIGSEDLGGVWSKGNVPRNREIAELAVRTARLCAAREHYRHLFFDENTRDYREAMEESLSNIDGVPLDHLMGLGLTMHAVWSNQGKSRDRP